MAKEFPTPFLDAIWAEHARFIDALYEDAGCARWELSRDAFAAALRRGIEKRFGNAKTGDGDSSAGLRAAWPEIEAYLKSLQIADLALACACAAGNERAWEFFVSEFRSDLRVAARAILRASGTTSGMANDARAEELADSLYAELYGIRSDAGGRRKSLFDYFHGRSKLSTWLRAVLAQRHVDLLRSGAKIVSLDAEGEEEASRQPASRADAVPADPRRGQYLARLDRALSSALADLVPRERTILACYYVDRRTLADIGQMLGEHESSVSRHLGRIRHGLRESVTRQLLRGAPAAVGCAAEPALDQAQVELAFEYALQDWPFDLSRALLTPTASGDTRKKRTEATEMP